MIKASTITSKRLAAIIATTVLLLAALSKIGTLLAKPALLSRLDPIIPFPNGFVLALVAVIELGTIGLLVSHTNSYVKGITLLWLTATFIGYKSALFLGGFPAACPCLGSLASQLGLSKAQLSSFSWFLILILICAGGLLISAGRVPGRSEEEPRAPFARGSMT